MPPMQNPQIQNQPSEQRAVPPQAQPQPQMSTQAHASPQSQAQTQSQAQPQSQGTGSYQSPPPYYAQPQMPPQYNQMPQGQYPPYQQPVYGMPQPMQEGNEPLGVFQYLIMMIVPMIPIVGFILMIIWAIGGSNTNVNRRNYARAYWILALISLAFSLLFMLLMTTALAPFAADLYNEFLYY